MPPTADQIARVPHLTEAQRRCIRLVAIGSSKHIAARLGISHRTVDQHIGAALQRLGVSDRYAALSLVQAWDATHPQDLPRQMPDVADSGASSILESPYPTRQPQWESGQIREPGIDYAIDAQPVSHDASAIPETLRHETTRLQTATKIIRLTLALAIILSAAEPIGRGFEVLAQFILHLRNK